MLESIFTSLRTLLGFTTQLGCSDEEAEIVIKKLPNGSLVAKGPGLDNKSFEAAMWALTRDTNFWTKEDLGRRITDDMRPTYESNRAN
jgi:hypothetical protein